MKNSTIEGIMAAAKSRQVEVPIEKIVNIIYRPTGTRLYALVASSEFTEQKFGNLIYIEGGSQHGRLGLVDVPMELSSGYFESKKILGGYDRDPATRKITSIYLRGEDLILASYFGTLDALMQNPNISKRHEY